MVSGAARLAGVIGWPVGHSKSPIIQNYWLEKYRIDGIYVPLAINPDHLEQVLKSLPLMGFRGVDVTLPHKETTLRLMDRLDPLAKRVGAVNTVVIDDDGMMTGLNTDVFGFVENLRIHQPDYDFSARPAMILGAGGAARAAIVGLQEQGCPEILVANRTIKRAEELADDLEGGGTIKIVPWEECEEHMADLGLLSNATQLGMTGQPPLPVHLGSLPKDAIVCDIVYSPMKTALLTEAEARGARIVNGLGMLLHQARPGFEAWFDILPDVDETLEGLMIAK